MPSPELDNSAKQRYLLWAICGCLIVAVALVYGQTLRFGFLDFDDNIFVTGSPQVQAGLTAKSIAWAFTNGPLGEWYPASMLSHMLDCQLFGLNAWGHHLTNLVLHAASAIGLFLVLRSMTGELWPSALVAMIFAVHPQRVESVAWIAERRDVLSGLFFVLTLAAYVGYVRHGRSPKWYLLVVLALALGLMAKSMLVTVPCLLLVLDYWPLCRFGKAADLPEMSPGLAKQNFFVLLAEKLPLLALAVGDSLISYYTHPVRREAYRLLPRMVNALVTLAEYLGQFFYPAKLAVFYPVPAAGYPAWQVAGSAALLVAITIVAILTRRRMPYLLVGWCWFVGMMVPVSGLVPLANHAMADRYMYLPGIGLAMALAWSATRVAQRSPAGGRLVAAGAAMATIAFAAVAAVQTTYWQDEMTLWRHAAAVTEDNAKLEMGLGDGLRHRRQLEEALDHYRKAALLDPDDPSIANNMGGTLYELGRLDEAVAAYARAIELDPSHVASHLSLATVLLRLGRPEEAERQLQRGVELAGDAPIPHILLAQLYLTTGRPDLALFERQAAATLDPNNAALRADLGRLRAQMGDADGAIADFRAALQIDPKLLAALVDLGNLLAARGEIEAAMAQLKKALAIDPDQRAVRENLDALRRTGSLPRP